MKLNWNIAKVVLAFVIVIGAIYWAVDSVRPRTYSGTSLNFEVGTDPVTVTNASDEPVPVQLVSTGSGSFRVSSQDETIAGSSTRQGTGTNTTQLFEFELPAGTSEFTILRGRDVSFVADSATSLEATINPAGGTTSIVVAAIIILVALFYASNTTEHSWLNSLRGRGTGTLATDTQPSGISAVIGGQGGVPQSYGDNRANTGD